MTVARVTGLAFAIGLVATLAAQDQPPRIRSGVDLLTADVQVVDGRGRPVLDLTPEDFNVIVGGRRRDVVSAELIRYGTDDAAPAADDAKTAREAGAAPRPRRMYVIAVDEPSIRFGAARAAMEAARRFIARLEPGDLVGFFAYPTGTAHVDLTTEHGDVLAALDRVTAMFEPPQTRHNISIAEALDIASHSRETYGQVTKRECGSDPACPREIQMAAQSVAMTLEMTTSRSLGGLEGFD
jgi:hypothetical protein